MVARKSAGSTIAAAAVLTLVSLLASYGALWWTGSVLVGAMVEPGEYGYARRDNTPVLRASERDARRCLPLGEGRNRCKDPAKRADMGVLSAIS